MSRRGGWYRVDAGFGGADLAETWRAEEAAPWLLAQLDRDPDDGLALAEWIASRVADRSRRGDVLRAQVEAWAEDQADRVDVRVARVVALLLSAHEDRPTRRTRRCGGA